MKSGISSPWLDTHRGASVEIEGRPEQLALTRKVLRANPHAHLKKSYLAAFENEKSPPRLFGGDFS
jgi:hypothetical protein